MLLNMLHSIYFWQYTDILGLGSIQNKILFWNNDIADGNDIWKLFDYIINTLLSHSNDISVYVSAAETM